MHHLKNLEFLELRNFLSRLVFYKKKYRGTWKNTVISNCHSTFTNRPFHSSWKATKLPHETESKEVIIIKKKLVSMSFVSNSLTVQGQLSSRFHVEAWLPFRNFEMVYWLGFHVTFVLFGQCVKRSNCWKRLQLMYLWRYNKSDLLLY